MCTEEVDPKDRLHVAAANSIIALPEMQDVYAAIHKGGLWLGPRFQARGTGGGFTRYVHSARTRQQIGRKLLKAHAGVQADAAHADGTIGRRRGASHPSFEPKSP